MNATAATADPVLSLDLDWTFVRRRANSRWLAGSEAKDETVVDLPHCWNEVDTFQYGRSYYKGYGCYRRRFQLPNELARPGRVLLEAEGFYGLAEIWLNGRRVGKIDGQYLGFELDVTSAIKLGEENILGVRLTNRCPNWVLPGFPKEPDFILYGGLSGRMCLRYLAQVAIERRSVQVTCNAPLSVRPELQIECDLSSQSTTPRECSVEWSVHSAAGEPIDHQHQTIHVSPGHASKAVTTLHIESPELWSITKPTLYRVVGRVTSNGEVLDRFEQSLGLRSVEFRPDQGFFLNNQRLSLRGVNRHESMPGFGSALPDSWHRRDAERIKTLGFNVVRLSHYPQHPRFLDACDEIGLLVIPEVATWKSVRRGRWLRSAVRQFREMILRDRHHPSVFLWSMGNESRDRKAYSELRSVAKALDPNRPVTYAENHFYRARRKKVLDLVDVWSINYELDALEDGREAASLHNVLVSECMNFPATVRGDWDAESTQLETITRDHHRLRDKPWVAGFVIWCLADYATQHRKRYRRLPGLLDAWGQPKLGAALIAAKQSDSPILELSGDWGYRTDSSRDDRSIHLLTNCREVGVYLDDRLLAEFKEGPHEIVFAPPHEGTLRARGLFGDKEITASLPWHGMANRTQILPNARTLDGTTRETIDFEVRILDQEGTLVTSWNGLVRVATAGPVRLRSFTSEPIIEISRGTGRGFLTATGGTGDLTLEVSADGLLSTSLRLEATVKDP